ncbi:unnamed protein product, partial [Dibothriocephalus latus]
MRISGLTEGGDSCYNRTSTVYSGGYTSVPDSFINWTHLGRDCHSSFTKPSMMEACGSFKPTTGSFPGNTPFRPRRLNRDLAILLTSPGGPGSSDSGVGDSSETAFERLQRLIAELADSVNVVDEISERVSGELDWRRLQLQSYQ